MLIDADEHSLNHIFRLLVESICFGKVPTTRLQISWVSGPTDRCVTWDWKGPRRLAGAGCGSNALTRCSDSRGREAPQ